MTPRCEPNEMNSPMMISEIERGGAPLP
jgi:hypothetical protein